MAPLMRTASEKYQCGAVVPDFANAKPFDHTVFGFLRRFNVDPDIHHGLARVPLSEGVRFVCEMLKVCGVESAGCLGTRRSCGSMLTTSPDLSGNLIGIHLDNWFSLPMSHRTQSPTRLTINVGPDMHWVLFVPEPVNSLLCGAPNELIPTTEHVRSALNSNLACTPCVAVRIEPGTGYVLNTELFPHDGSTYWSRQGSTILCVSLAEHEVERALASEIFSFSGGHLAQHRSPD